MSSARSFFKKFKLSVCVSEKTDLKLFDRDSRCEKSTQF